MSVADALAGTSAEGLAKPLHVQRLEEALRLDPLLNYVEALAKQNSQNDAETSTDGDTDLECGNKVEEDAEGNKIYNGAVVVTKAERRADKHTHLYNFSKVKRSRKWLKNILLSDSSSEDEGYVEKETSKEEIHQMLHMHKYQKHCRERFYQDKELQQYQYLSVGLLSSYDKFHEHQRAALGPKKKISKEQKKLEKILKKAKMKLPHSEELEDGEIPAELLLQGNYFKEGAISDVPKGPTRVTKSGKVKKLTPEQIAAKRRKIWISLSKKEVPKTQKQKASARKELMSSLRKVAKECQKECRRAALQSQKIMKEASGRARRLCKEMQIYWKRFEKVEKEHRKRAEKEAQEQRKMDVELIEAKRQQRKLNFLITQTELYAHFMARKMTGATEEDKGNILGQLEDDETEGGIIQGDTYDCSAAKSRALKNAEQAFHVHQSKKQSFDVLSSPERSQDNGLSLANPTISTEEDRPQPALFEGKLKSYQLKGMNWLANLYDQGINGILADEMGLGKTVQSIAFLAHLAETYGIWGPFLVIAPASTLHNWQQEMSKFGPKFRCVPYWGNTQDRKILRKFWNSEAINTQEASFHVVITSYQLVIQDVKYFQRIKWHYMILDEAQAIKSTASARWKVLLGFNCRNRLLLSGTPIQNTMAELWALLHFIMPTLFDSHDEFNDWFSKDIESHAERQSGIDENQLSRLHMILKPFMLRRVKKDVENELSDKIEILVYCPLTTRQKLLYQAVKNKISIEDLLQTAYASGNTTQVQTSTSSLMNLVMQFRKVCNHPELFERREITSPFFMRLKPYVVPKLIYREGILSTAIPSSRHLLFNKLCIYNPVHIHQSLFHKGATESCGCANSCFSFTRFIDLSAAELQATYLQGLLYRWLAVFLWLKKSQHIQHQRDWHTDIRLPHTRQLDKDSFLLSPVLTTSPGNLSSSPNLRSLIFTSSTSSVYTHISHTLHYIPETASHRKVRLRKPSARDPLTPRSPGVVLMSPKRGPLSPPLSPHKTPLSPTRLIQSEEPAHRHIPRFPRVYHLRPTELPRFLYYTIPRALSGSCRCYTVDRSAEWDYMRQQLCGTRDARNALLYGTPELAGQLQQRAQSRFDPAQPQGLLGLRPHHGFSGVNVPNKEMLVTDAGKLSVLDSLLARLKEEGHRVLIYSQMTRMIDILEEYMWHRKHTYMRLDGSSKIHERRDMVADFQTRSDIFTFLLSTRAGGLGINLTAADTVIFYDSDWNPTVDQQAMDRAHRLGQTKQVTVYRLINKGTIEERILQRAREKSEIQRMVISGGQFRPDILKPKEVVSLLLDDDEMEKKVSQKTEDKGKREDLYKERDRERKRKKYQHTRTGRGPGRPPKIKKLEEDQNMTIPAAHHASGAGGSGGAASLMAFSAFDGDSNLSMSSAAASPQSVKSIGSELTRSSMTFGDDSSNDALVIVDDNSTSSSLPARFVPVTPPPPSSSTPKRGTGRPRGRPRGSGVGRRPRGRGSVLKALSAAEAAGAQAAAAKAAKHSTIGYSLGSEKPSPATPSRGGPSPLHRGRGGSPRGFYSQRPPPP